MLKRLSFAIVAFLALAAQAFGAGSISLSLSQQFDSQGRPLAGGLLYFFTSGTTTPQNAFQDTALTIPYPNPLVLDASGRVPPFYLADGLIKIRLTTSGGVTVIAADGLLVIGPSSGGGGGGSIDATTILATGDVKTRYGVGTLSGFVRANGRTIGSATSGATERANADCQALFEYLWTTDANLVVSSGRGATANADWLANKTIALPDMRGRIIAGMDDMGTTAASRLTTAGFGTSAIVLGAAGGTETKTIAQTNIPSYSLAMTGATFTFSSGTASSFFTVSPTYEKYFPGGIQASNSTLNINVVDNGSGFTTTALSTNGTIQTNITGISGTIGGTIASGGSGTAMGVTQPTMTMTFYIKL